jgi:predicted nucleotidyltransferase
MVQTTLKKGIVFFELEKTRRIIEKAMHLEITWAYEDIVFVEHSAFLIRFDKENTTKLHCYFNTDCPKMESKFIYKCLVKAADEEAMSITNSGTFTLLEGKGKDEIQVKFLEAV